MTSEIQAAVSYSSIFVGWKEEVGMYWRDVSRKLTHFIDYWTFTVLGWVPYKPSMSQPAVSEEWSERRKNAVSVEPGSIWSRGKTWDTELARHHRISPGGQEPASGTPPISHYFLSWGCRRVQPQRQFLFCVSQSAEETTAHCVLLSACLHDNWKRSTWVTMHFYCDHIDHWDENWLWFWWGLTRGKKGNSVSKLFLYYKWGKKVN